MENIKNSTQKAFLSNRINLILLAVISAYYIVVLLFTVNFPIGDDFELIEFINEFLNSGSFSEKINLLFAQHNEHRIFFPRLIFLLYYKLVGVLNFKALCFFGNLAILGMYCVIVKNLPEKFRMNIYVMIPVTCLLFQYGSAESMLWAMASLSNYYVLFFALLTLNFITKENTSGFILALLFAALSTFTIGNGILVFIIGNLYLLIQKRYNFFYFWLFFTCLTLLIYFYGYTAPQVHSDPPLFFENSGKILLFTFAFIGSAFGIGGSHYPVLTKIFLVPTTVVGIIVCIITLFFFYKKKYKDGNIFIWINLYIIASAFVAALSRYQFDISQALASRYHIYSNLIIISTFLLIFDHFTLNETKIAVSGKIPKIFSLFCIFFTIITFPLIIYFSYIAYEPIREGGIIHPRKSEAVKILKNAEVNGVFIVNKK